ncbi:hypothetical protein Tco_1085632 [Tanacetum coccineum]
MERGTSLSTGRFSWSFNDSNLFSGIFINSNLFSEVFNTSTLFSKSFDTSKLFSGNFKKCRVLKLQALVWKDNGFDIEIKDKRGAANLVADHLSRLKNPELSTFTEEEIANEFPDEHLMAFKTEINNDEPCVSVIGRKVYESGFFWPSIFKDAKDYVIRCDACQRLGNISSRSEMPQNNIQICDVFDV